jgi:hypothetical protein
MIEIHGKVEFFLGKSVNFEIKVEIFLGGQTTSKVFLALDIFSGDFNLKIIFFQKLFCKLLFLNSF